MTDHTPDWTKLATQALIRLRAEYTTPPDQPDMDDDDGRTYYVDDTPRPRRARKMSDRPSLLDALAAASAALQIPLEEQQAVRDEGGDPLAADSQGKTSPQVWIPAGKLLLTLRLCATFTSTARLAAMLDPGAVTVLELGDVPLRDARHLLQNVLMAPDVQIPGSSALSGQDAPTLCTALLGESDRAAEQDRPRERLIAALEQPRPVAILTRSLADIPDDILRVLPVPLRLAPLSRDILMAHLRASHSATGKLDDGLRTRLPQDRDLARLAWPTIAAALRAAYPNGVAQALQEATRRKISDGPTLAQIEGYGSAEAAARQMVADLQGWSEGRVAWSDVQRSVLLYGAPGTGKSHLAQAMANSAGVALVRGSFAIWQAQGNLNHMLAAMRASFAEAAAARPAILILDEVDAVGNRADPDPRNANYRHQVINGFLEAMDGLKTLEGVLVVGTCNHPETIDAAVLRPGRFDVKCEVPLPGPQALARMIHDGMSTDISPMGMTQLTRAAAGQSAADVDGALRQARTVARAASRPVEITDVLTALCPDPEDLNPALDHRIALHECGHAIVATHLGVGRISRLTLGKQGGQAWIQYSTTEQRLQDYEAELAYILAGRAAERLILGNISGGAGGNTRSDLAQATGIAVDIDTRFGLGAEGAVWLDTPTGTYLRDPRNTARIQDRLQTAETRARQILETHRPLLEEMTAILEEHHMLEGATLEEWLGRVTPVREPKLENLRSHHPQDTREAPADP